MNINLKDFTTIHPTEPGLYLWNSGTDKKPEVRSISVVAVPERVMYGIKWDPYLSVPAMGGRNVEHLRGTFLKLEFI
ncbi:hypothetical protein ASwh1_326 [Aeromonas phage Aswh_1]|nr:hypothetical protein ASwh1_326 [Aeromonas phage Aswh_1]